MNTTQSPETRPLRPLEATDDVLLYLNARKAAYTHRHHHSDNAHEQFMIEFHASQLEHAIELMEEVRDMIKAEILWLIQPLDARMAAPSRVT